MRAREGHSARRLTAVWFTAQKFRCPVCNLRLDSQAEIEEAKVDTSREI